MIKLDFDEIFLIKTPWKSASTVRQLSAQRQANGVHAFWQSALEASLGESWEPV